MDDIENWKKSYPINCVAMLVIYDKEDKDYYPVYVLKGQNIENIIKRLNLSEGKQKVCQTFIFKGE